jgi:hypothetical protein
MIRVNETCLNEYYKDCAARARTLAELAIGEETRAAHLTRARLYDQIAASYMMIEQNLLQL